MTKRSVAKPASLSTEEVQALGDLSFFARVMYLIALRPYSNEDGIVAVSERVIEARLDRVYSHGCLDAVRTDAELARLVKRNRITPAYRDETLNLVSVVY